MTTTPTIVDKLGALTPAQFENIVYDLVTSAGLRNAVWRTPGADGGRDIEGEMATTDFSGFSVNAKWYIECKRYAAAVDWPTVWGKIAYADSHGADYLLVVTTSSLSPQCKTEVSTWNAGRRRPAVRFWEGHNLEQVLAHYPRILVKHGLAGDTKLVPASFVSSDRSAQRGSRFVG
jgi:HJR/Mrr/RecB family endonuclease